MPADVRGRHASGNDAPGTTGPDQGQPKARQHTSGAGPTQQFASTANVERVLVPWERLGPDGREGGDLIAQVAFTK
jgi:hypothetical protein